MVNQLLKEVLEPKIRQLHWVENYANLTRILRRKGANGKEAYPVALDRVSNCWRENTYQDLVPNDQYKSTLYWQSEKTGTKIVQGRSRKDLMAFSAKLKLVGWFNLNKLGEVSSFSSAAYTDLLKSLQGKHMKSGDFSNIQVSFTGLDASPEKSVFSQYAYADNERIFLHPYEAFAADVEIYFTIPLNCITYSAPKPEISC